MGSLLNSVEAFGGIEEAIVAVCTSHLRSGVDLFCSVLLDVFKAESAQTAWCRISFFKIPKLVDV